MSRPPLRAPLLTLLWEERGGPKVIAPTQGGLPWHTFTRESVQPLEPGMAVPVELDLLPISYLFKQGIAFD